MVPMRDRGAGRPTKRERRDIEKLRGPPEDSTVRPIHGSRSSSQPAPRTVAPASVARAASPRSLVTTVTVRPSRDEPRRLGGDRVVALAVGADDRDRRSPSASAARLTLHDERPLGVPARRGEAQRPPASTPSTARSAEPVPQPPGRAGAIAPPAVGHRADDVRAVHDDRGAHAEQFAQPRPRRLEAGMQRLGVDVGDRRPLEGVALGVADHRLEGLDHVGDDGRVRPDAEVQHAREPRAHGGVRHARPPPRPRAGRPRSPTRPRDARRPAAPTCRRSGSTTPGAAAARRARRRGRAAPRRRSAPSTAPPIGAPPTRHRDRAARAGGAARRVRGARSSPLQPFTCARRPGTARRAHPTMHRRQRTSGPTTAGRPQPIGRSPTRAQWRA